MRPFWVNVEPRPSPAPENLGIGVTARSEEDALGIIRELFGDRIVVKSIEQIRDMRALEQNHVAPNMEPNWFLRGVWFPKGHRPD